MSIENYCNEILSELEPVYDMESSLKEAFINIIKYLNQFPENLSVRNKKHIPDVTTKEGIQELAIKYFSEYYTPTIPKLPKTIPDNLVSFIMKKVFHYSDEELNVIKKTHLESMSTETALGTLLERYLDSVLREANWAWCCGDFVKAIDFIKYKDGIWYELQIKNRSNSENSSSSKIREGTSIHKWYRISATTGKTRWDKLPEIMNDLNLSEDGFQAFVEKYLEDNINLGKAN